jgi:hypothetical protein
MADQEPTELSISVTPDVVDVGGAVQLKLNGAPPSTSVSWSTSPAQGGVVSPVDDTTAIFYPDTAATYSVTAVLTSPEQLEVMVEGDDGESFKAVVGPRTPLPITPDIGVVVQPTPFSSTTGAPAPTPVTLTRTSQLPTIDQQLWTMIRNRTNAIGFRNYRPFIDEVMATPSYGSYSYELLKQATDAFLMHETGVVEGSQLAEWQRQHPDRPLSEGRARLDPVLEEERLAQLTTDQQRSLRLDEARRLGFPPSILGLQQMRTSYYKQLTGENVAVLPYLDIIRDRLADIPLKSEGETAGSTYGILRSRLTGPVAVELIWSYWHEEGMLVQTLNAILARFQNRRLTAGRDPLARFDLDPLRPLSNIFWGWASDEIHRLTVRRRAYEYDHEYGLALYGKAVPNMRTADSRSRFLGAFHNLLHLTHVFYKEDDDTTVIADGFAVLNALREVHLLLAEGAHNQFGDLPSAARAEMLIMEWILARPEMREFLGGRVMVPYEETWMDRVDTVKSMFDWTDTSITHFRDLGVYGEQILLSVRYGNWSVINDPQQAANWARYWRPEIQRYVHAYRAATGADLTERVDVVRPGIHLQRRLAAAPGRPH